MARWGWGRGAKECGPVDRIDEYPARVFDESGEIHDWIDFVDEEKGVYRVLVREDPDDRPTPGLPSPRACSPWKVVNDEIVTQMKKAKGKLRVFLVGESSS